MGTQMPQVRWEQVAPSFPHHDRHSSIPSWGSTYLEVADLKNGLRVGKMVLLQVGIEASGWGAEVRDARG